MYQQKLVLLQTWLKPKKAEKAERSIALYLQWLAVDYFAIVFLEYFYFDKFGTLDILKKGDCSDIKLCQVFAHPARRLLLNLKSVPCYKPKKSKKMYRA